MYIDFMEDQTKSLLNGISEVLDKAKAPLANILQKGIGKETIQEKIKGLNINLPGEVYALYEWRNGTFIPDDSYSYDQTWIFPLGTFCSIEESVESYRYFVGNDDYWNNTMFMLFKSGTGEMYLIDCNDESPTYHMIYKHWVGAVDYEVV